MDDDDDDDDDVMMMMMMMMVKAIHEALSYNLLLFFSQCRTVVFKIKRCGSLMYF